MKFHGITMVGSYKNEILSSLPSFVASDEGREVYLTDGTRWYCTADKWEQYGSGGISFNLNQAGHGFSTMDAVYHNGTIWAKAQADDITTVATHIVIAVDDIDNCVLAQSGRWEVTGHGLTIGYHYVSETVAGDLTQDPGNVINQIILVIDADFFIVLPYWSYDSSSLGGGASFTLEQVAHGFTALDAIYHNGTIWAKAQADDGETLATHLVTEVLDADSVIAAQAGRFEITSHGLTVGEFYYVDDTTAGLISSTESLLYSNPIAYVEDTDFIHVLPYRPSTSGVGGAGGGYNWLYQGIDVTINNNDGVLMDTSTAPHTITCKDTPIVGDTFAVFDHTGSFAINNCTIDGNGFNIMGLSEDMILDIPYVGVTFVYSDETIGWAIVDATPVVGAPLSNVRVDTFVDGVNYTSGTTTQLTLSDTPASENSMQVMFDAAYQHTTEFSVFGDVITFDSPIPLGVDQVEISIFQYVDQGTVGDGTITFQKLSSDVIERLITGAGGDKIFIENDQTVTANYAITSGKNAGSFGPIAIADGITVTITDGSVWSIV